MTGRVMMSSWFNIFCGDHGGMQSLDPEWKILQVDL